MNASDTIVTVTHRYHRYMSMTEPRVELRSGGAFIGVMAILEDMFGHPGWWY